MAQVPIQQFNTSDIVTFQSGPLSGATFFIRRAELSPVGTVYQYLLERILDDDQRIPAVPEGQLRRVASEGDGAPYPLDTVFRVPEQVSPELFGWRVNLGDVVLRNGVQKRVQAFNFTSSGIRQVLFTDAGSSRPSGASVEAVEAWEEQFRRLDGTGVRETPLRPPQDVPGGPEPPSGVPSPTDFPEVPSVSDLREAVAAIREGQRANIERLAAEAAAIRNDISETRREIVSLPTASPEFIGERLEATEGRLQRLIEGLALPEVSDLLGLVPSLAAFLSSPLEYVLGGGDTESSIISTEVLDSVRIR